LTKADPFFYNGARAVQKVAGLGHAQIAERIQNPGKVKRVDLLARLMEGRDASGNPLSLGELTAEALTQLVAGSDTMSNSTCALIYHVIHTPSVLAKLQKELDTALPSSDDVPEYSSLKDLP
jgi:benzoate 4-monooxygenase